MLDGELTVVGQKAEEVSRQLIDLLLKMDKELFTIYYGEDTTSAAAQELSDYILSRNGNCEVEVHEGGQPLYHYIISAE